MVRRKADLLICIAYYSVIGLGVFLSLRYLLPVTLPFIAAFAISYALRKPVTVLQERFRRVPRKVVSFAVLAMFYTFFGVAFTLIFRSLAIQLIDFLSTLPSLLSELSDTMMASLEPVLERLPDWLFDGSKGDSAGQIIVSAAETLASPLMELLSAAGSAAFRLPSVIFAVVITVIASFFITLDYEGAKTTVLSVFPERFRSTISRAKQKSVRAVIHLLGSYGKLMLITFGELCVGFWIINLLGGGVDYVVPLSLIISIVDILPVLGVGTVLIPWAAAVFISGSSKLCIMLLVLCAIIYIVRNALESRLVSHSFGLHPAITLLALYVGGKWFGIIGFFALPLILMVAVQLRAENPSD